MNSDDRLVLLLLLVPAVRVVGRPHQAVRRGGNVITLRSDDQELDDTLAVLSFIAAGRLEQAMLSRREWGCPFRSRAACRMYGNRNRLVLVSREKTRLG